MTNNKKCEVCGGSKSTLADDYFIKKCWCDEIQEEENEYAEQDQYD